MTNETLLFESSFEYVFLFGFLGQMVYKNTTVKFPYYNVNFENYYDHHHNIAHCCVSNYPISDLKDHFTAKIPDSASGQFTSGSACSLKR